MTSLGAQLGFLWPFATESPSQYERVDQGWDLQSTAGAAVEAIAPGVIGQANPDPGGFGNNYPYETLSSPPAGAPSNTVYYGHIHVLPGVVGQYVQAGQIIGYTNTTEGQQGSAAPPGWLEIGFAQPGTGAPVQRGSETVATQAGQDMKNFLLGAPVATGATLTSFGGTVGGAIGSGIGNVLGPVGSALGGSAGSTVGSAGANIGADISAVESWALRFFIGLAGAALVVAALIMAGKESDMVEHPVGDAAKGAALAAE